MKAIWSKKTLAAIATFGFSSLAFHSDLPLCEIPLGDLNDLKDGEMKRVKIGERDQDSIIIIKKQSKVVAFSGNCCHFGAPLDQGYFDGQRIWCPWHLASFCSGSGSLNRAPGLNSLKKYEVKQMSNGQFAVYISKNDMESVGSSCPSQQMTKGDFSDKRIFAIVGGGYAGQMAAEQLRKAGFKGKIVIISKEQVPPYDRTILSKSFKSNVENLQLREAQFYEEYGIELMVNKEVVSIDIKNHSLTTKDKQKIKFDKLLLATGSDARELSITIRSFPNLHKLRSSEDYKQIQSSIEQAQNIVIVGGGFIGMEASAAIKRDFKDKTVTVFEKDPRPMERIFGPEISSQLVALQKQNGVEIISSNINNFITDGNEKITHVTYQIGDEFRNYAEKSISADLVLQSIGSEINTKFVPPQLLNPDGSVKVNQFMQTNCPDIYAAGDIASFQSLITENQERVQHWAVAGDQGMVAASNMLGGGVTYKSVPFFWTKQSGSAHFVGFNRNADWHFTETLQESTPDKTQRITYFFKGQRVIGCSVINVYGGAIKLLLAIEYGLMPSRDDICNQKVGYKQISEAVQNAKMKTCCQGKN